MLAARFDRTSRGHAPTSGATAAYASPEGTDRCVRREAMGAVMDRWGTDRRLVRLDGRGWTTLAVLLLIVGTVALGEGASPAVRADPQRTPVPVAPVGTSTPAPGRTVSSASSADYVDSLPKPAQKHPRLDSHLAAA